MEADPATYPLTIRLLGPFDARVRGEPLPRLRTRKGQWLLALLALRHGRDVERSWLAGTLWPDSDELRAHHSLRMALTDLRRALGAEAGRILAPTNSILRLDLADAEVDVIAFDAAVERGRTAERDEVVQTALEEAIRHYRGPLLERCVEEWAFPERQAREEAYLKALE